MSGDDGPGTNPEQLFAVGYAACFRSALLGVAQGRNLDATGSQITSRVGIGPLDSGGFGLQISLDLHAPNIATEEAHELMLRLDQIQGVTSQGVTQHPTAPQRLHARPVKAGRRRRSSDKERAPKLHERSIGPVSALQMPPPRAPPSPCKRRSTRALHRGLHPAREPASKAGPGRDPLRVREGFDVGFAKRSSPQNRKPPAAGGGSGEPVTGSDRSGSWFESRKTGVGHGAP